MNIDRGKRGGVSITALSLLLLLFAFPRGPSGASNTKADDFKWEEAANEVMNLPFPQRFIDSLRESYRVTCLEHPLRTVDKPERFRGETLVYDVGWGPFKAGYVILTADFDAKAGTLRIGAKALSNNVVGAFYRMRDYIITHLDAKGLYPLFFEQHLREGKRYRSDGWILYDYERKKIHVKERHLKTLDAPNFVNDYLSVLYLIRTKSFSPGDTFTLSLYVDKKIHSMNFICRERKNLSIESGDAACVMLEPRLIADKGNFNKKDKLEVWFTDDEYKRPVLIRSKIKVGSITARLINHTAAAQKAAPQPADKKGTDTAAALPPVPSAAAEDTSSGIIDSSAMPGDTSKTPSDTAAAAQ